MYAIEFETEIRNGVMVIPEKYARLKNTMRAWLFLLMRMIPGKTRKFVHFQIIRLA